MFAKIAKATTLAALIAVGATAVGTSQASAGQVQFGIQFGNGYGYVYGPGYGPQWGPGPSWGGPRGYCKPRRAVKKARRMGVRNAHIVRRNHRKVVVKGWRYGYRTRVVFANRRHCPVIAFR
ncbi:hypothetical protein [Hoeflea sp. TYP-13]|uniref:hypothetical protein n=1 Tax=Hoeflea sp. TYP-13 TaxID=3230023 RepID=UPI0034C6DDB3